MSFKQLPIRSRNIFIACILSILILIYRTFTLSKFSPPYMVFCSVGQGSAVYIRIKNNIDILFDAGPDGNIGECLRKHMPFTDKFIDYVFITHAQSDHVGGLVSLARSYDLGVIFQYCYKSGDCMRINKGKKITMSRAKGEYIIGIIAKIKYYIPNYGSSNRDTNKDSVIYRFEMNGNIVLIPGDIPTDGLRKVMYENSNEFENVDVLLVPHHGSRMSVSIPFYRFVKPKLAIISVGKDNQYGHPSKYLLDILKRFNIPYKRTDEAGDILIKLNYRY